MWRIWVRIGGCIVLVGKLEGKRPLGWPSCRWVDNIRMDLQEVGCGYMDWIGLAQDRDRWRTLVSVVMNLQVPWNAGNFLTSCKPDSCSRRTLHRGVSKEYLSDSSSGNFERKMNIITVEVTCLVICQNVVGSTAIFQKIWAFFFTSISTVTHDINVNAFEMGATLPGCSKS